MSKIFYIRGSQKNPQKVIERLKEKGASNPMHIRGNCPDTLYFITDDNKIGFVLSNSTFGRMLIQQGKELFIEPDYKFKVGDKVLYHGEKLTIARRLAIEGEPYYNVDENTYQIYEPNIEPCIQDNFDYSTLKDVIEKQIESIINGDAKILCEYSNSIEMMQIFNAGQISALKLILLYIKDKENKEI